MSAGVSLDDAITSLPGVGPRTAERLGARGLRTIADLLFHLPRGYDDLRRVTPIAALAQVPAGQVVLVRGVVARVRIFPRRLLDVYVQEGDAAGDGGAVAMWRRSSSALSANSCWRCSLGRGCKRIKPRAPRRLGAAAAL